MLIHCNCLSFFSMYVLHHISLNILLDVYVCKLDLIGIEAY